MKAICLILLAVFVSLSHAKPWYASYNAEDEGYFDNEGYYHRSQSEAAAAYSHKRTYQQLANVQQQQPGQLLCTSASHGTGIHASFLHICKQDDEFCFFSNGNCCNFPSGRDSATADASFALELPNSNFRAEVNYYSAERGANCYDIRPANLDLVQCRGCDPRPCIDQTCQENIESCEGGSCVCTAGYSPEDCCSCDFQNKNNKGRFYKDPQTGECKELCQSFCASTPTIDGCSECQPGYKAPDCCKCADGYYKHPREGTCRPPCSGNYVSCTNGVCQCKPQYQQPDCCKCAPGYYKSGTRCEEPCEGAESCRDGICTCKPGYQGDDCCDCAPGFYKDNADGKCKDPCKHGVVRCINGRCSCAAGYTGENCCDCDIDYYKNPRNICEEPCKPGFSSCVNGVCTCTPGYTGPKCCDCAPGHYKAEDNSCKKPCEKNIESCTNGVCTCKERFTGADCCDETKECGSYQDIYVVLDVTKSFSKEEFCEVNFGTELLLRTLNPSSDLSGTRLSVVLYPVGPSKSNPGVAHELFSMGTGCEEAVGKVATLIDGFTNEGAARGQPQPYLNYIFGRQTCPGPALAFVKESIQKERREGIPSSRKKYVIIVTDGYNDVDPVNEMTALKDQEGVTVLVAGYSKHHLNKLEEFRNGLVKMAGVENNVVMGADPMKLMQNLVDRIVEVGIGCPDQGKMIDDNLKATKSIQNYCDCVWGRSFTQLKCGCPGQSADQCRSPPKCAGQTNEFNEWYIGSPNYNCFGTGGQCEKPLWGEMQRHNSKADTQYHRGNERELLEEEIIAAVEEILGERQNG